MEGVQEHEREKEGCRKAGRKAKNGPIRRVDKIHTCCSFLGCNAKSSFIRRISWGRKVAWSRHGIPRPCLRPPFSLFSAFHFLFSPPSAPRPSSRRDDPSNGIRSSKRAPVEWKSSLIFRAERSNAEGRARRESLEKN